MLNRVLSNNRVFGAVVCVLVFIAAGLLYLQSAKREVARDVPPLRETVKPQQPPRTGAQPPEASQGGHFHEDGAWHAGPHEIPETRSPGASPEARDADSATPLPQDALEPVLPSNGASQPSQGEVPHIEELGKPLSDTQKEQLRQTLLNEINTLHQKSREYGVKVKEIVPEIKTILNEKEEHMREQEVLRSKIKTVGANGRLSSEEKAVQIASLKVRIQEHQSAWDKLDRLIQEKFAIAEGYAAQRREIGEQMDEINKSIGILDGREGK